MVGLYMDPPTHAVVLSTDEKSQIPAPERTRPAQPLGPDHPAARAHDYVRHGTTTLSAALNAVEGTVLGRCVQHRRHGEFIRLPVRGRSGRVARLVPTRLLSSFRRKVRIEDDGLLTSGREFHLHAGREMWVIDVCLALARRVLRSSFACLSGHCVHRPQSVAVRQAL